MILHPLKYQVTQLIIMLLIIIEISFKSDSLKQWNWKWRYFLEEESILHEFPACRLYPGQYNQEKKSPDDVYTHLYQNNIIDIFPLRNAYDWSV